MKKVGIYGGTFNPVHNGHINIAKHAIEELGLDKLIIVPSGVPPHKKVVATDKNLRYEMAKLAFNDAKMEVSDYEIKKESPSYTSETLEYFSDKDTELFLIIGGDSLKGIESWNNPYKLFELATLYSIGRMSDLPKIVEDNMGKVVFSSYDPGDYSSTDIRVLLEFGEDVTNLIPKSVLEFIKGNNLYSVYSKYTKGVKSYLKKSRYVHTINVVKMALKLNSQLQIKESDVFISATLHDVAKYLSSDYSNKYKKELEKENIFIPEKVLHAFLGALVARDDFDIENEEILNAIKYHTTAKPNMNALEKLIYLSDAIEMSRLYDGVEELRKEACESVDKAFIKCLKQTSKFIENNAICPLTNEALKYYEDNNYGI